MGARESLISPVEFHKLLFKSILVNQRIIIPGMIKANQGNMLHVGCIASYEAVGFIGYNTVKAGICGYVRSLGRDVAKWNCSFRNFTWWFYL